MPVFRPDLSLCFRDPVLRLRGRGFVLSHSLFLRRLVILFSLGAASALALGVAAFFTPWGRTCAWTEFWTMAIALALVFGVPTIIFLVLKAAHSYRLEVFPFEGVACLKRYWLGVRVSARQSQIGDTADGFVLSQVEAEFREVAGPTGSSKGLLEGLLYLMGPLGSLIGINLLETDTKIRREPMFVLHTTAGLASGLPPIACFYTLKDAAVIIDRIEKSLLLGRPVTDGSEMKLMR